MRDELRGLTKEEYGIALGLCDKGLEILGPERYQDWTEEVIDSVQGKYCGEDAALCLVVADALNKGESFGEIEEMLYKKTGDREDLRNLVLIEVGMYCEKGEQFKNYMSVVDLDWEREER